MARGIFEWSFNIIVLIFATSMVAQPFIIPTGSMESTLLVGDHILVDKLAYAPAGTLPLLPYAEPKHGDIIVFRYPPATTSPKSKFPQANTSQWATTAITPPIAASGASCPAKTSSANP